MPKKLRRSLHNSQKAIKNFCNWLPSSTANMVREIPTAMGRFKSWILTFRGSITIICLVGLIVFSLVGSDYQGIVLIYSMIFAIFAASWDFLAGIAGQVSFGQSIFFGIAGYTAALLLNYYSVPWLLCILIGALAGVSFGLIVGVPCLRLKGPYLALGTQAFTLILQSLFSMATLEHILYGSEGIHGLPPIAQGIPALGLSAIQVLFFIVLSFMIISFTIMILIAKSNIGTIFKSIRDDELAADASGINTTKYKLVAFMISGFFAGIAGSLFALNNRAVNPSVFQPLYSFYAIIMASIGGIATITGSLIGAFLFYVLSEYLRPLAGWALLIFSAVLIIIIRFQERGILNPALDRLREFYDFIRGR